jgi:hypothetical protein
MEKNRLILFLDEEISSALLSMAREDCRNPTLETLWVLREEAKRRGLLSETDIIDQLKNLIGEVKDGNLF